MKNKLYIFITYTLLLACNSTHIYTDTIFVMGPAYLLNWRKKGEIIYKKIKKHERHNNRYIEIFPEKNNTDKTFSSIELRRQYDYYFENLVENLRKRILNRYVASGQISVNLISYGEGDKVVESAIESLEGVLDSEQSAIRAEDVPGTIFYIKPSKEESDALKQFASPEASPRDNDSGMNKVKETINFNDMKEQRKQSKTVKRSSWKIWRRKTEKFATDVACWIVDALTPQPEN